MNEFYLISPFQSTRKKSSRVITNTNNIFYRGEQKSQCSHRRVEQSITWFLAGFSGWGVCVSDVPVIWNKHDWNTWRHSVYWQDIEWWLASWIARSTWTDYKISPINAVWVLSANSNSQKWRLTSFWWSRSMRSLPWARRRVSLRKHQQKYQKSKPVKTWKLRSTRTSQSTTNRRLKIPRQNKKTARTQRKMLSLNQRRNPGSKVRGVTCSMHRIYSKRMRLKTSQLASWRVPAGLGNYNHNDLDFTRNEF